MKALTGVLMDFQVVTGVEPCIAFAGFCIVITGILSLTIQPWQTPQRRPYESIFNPFDEGIQWSKYDKLWNEKIAPVLFAVGMIAMGTFTLWFAASTPALTDSTEQNNSIHIREQ